MNQLINAVEQSAHQQRELTSEVSQHIHSIAQAAEHNLEATHTVNDGSNDLKEKVVEFYQLAQRFEEK
ncbi:hypothetical protein EJ063_05955 [Vibrio aquaticus]|uniref:Methyl-accepting chemotaxis protein n=1 Tax=Vibrio aquaticus TaxID=2496559 RepID=A0A3S0P9I9_9VIBR|nr:hypothetical protein [Vibrio aquaticus]RTZ18324.1 hypothetical protein EJ063_05955 [Vibrio aquaticus]